MHETVILDGLRTPIGRYRGSLSGVRPDDLAADLLQGLLDRNEPAKEAVEEVILGATNQAGEDNRNIARMAALLAGLPYEVTRRRSRSGRSVHDRLASPGRGRRRPFAEAGPDRGPRPVPSTRRRC